MLTSHVEIGRKILAGSKGKIGGKYSEINLSDVVTVLQLQVSVKWIGFLSFFAKAPQYIVFHHVLHKPTAEYINKHISGFLCYK